MKVGMPRIPILDLHAPFQFIRHFLKRRSDHLARAAPFRPKIHQNGAVSAKNIRCEICIGYGMSGHV
jgi:hypothetical protein